MNESTDAADECVSRSRAAKILGVCVRTVRREIDAVSGPFQIATVYGVRKEPTRCLTGSNALIPTTTPV
jgi:hypothetical protein